MPATSSPPPPPTEPLELAAALDLGSNSFHMVVARLEGGQLHIIDKLREPVRFASGLDANRYIGPKAMARALACLERFGQRVASMSSDRVRAVGTNTLRQARNGHDFMKRACVALGHPVEIISGREEARLIYLGVAQTMPDRGRRLVVDIGGGSTEVIVGEGFDIVEADSLYMGCVSFSLKFFPDGALTARGFRQARLAAELELQSIAQPYRKLGWETVVGCSGTVHAVQQVIRQNGWGDDGITPRSLRKVRKALVAAGSTEGLQLAGLQPDRALVFAGGVAILEAFVADFRVEQMMPSPGALREGLLYDLVGRINHEDIRDRTIRWFQERYHVDRAQAEHVAETALRLLHQANRTWGLEESWAQQHLHWAAQLFETGLAVAHTGYHKHGAYLVTNAHLAGFSREEQRTVASLIASHRRKVKVEVFQALDPSRVPEVLKLCVLFRLAIRLNRGRDATRPPVVLKVRKERLRLYFPAGWLEAHPLTRAALDQESAYLASIGYSLSLKDGPADPADGGSVAPPA